MPTDYGRCSVSNITESEAEIYLIVTVMYMLQQMNCPEASTFPSIHLLKIVSPQS